MLYRKTHPALTLRPTDRSPGESIHRGNRPYSSAREVESGGHRAGAGGDGVWTLSEHPDSWTSETVAAQGRQSGLIWSAWPQDHTGLEIPSAGMLWRWYQQGLPGNTAQNGPCFPAPAGMYPGPTAQPSDLNSVGPWNRKSPEEKILPSRSPPPRFINFITFYNKH